MVLYCTKCFRFLSKMHENRCRLGLRPRPHWGSLQRSPRPPSCVGLGWRFLELCTPVMKSWLRVSHIMCKDCHLHLRSLRHIRRSLTDDTAILIAVVLVQSRLDYCNSLFFNMSCFNINKLQHVQILAARRALNDWRSPTQQIFVELYWLPIQSRIKFKCAHLLHISYFLKTNLRTSDHS